MHPPGTHPHCSKVTTPPSDRTHPASTRRSRSASGDSRADNRVSRSQRYRASDVSDAFGPRQNCGLLQRSRPTAATPPKSHPPPSGADGPRLEWVEARAARGSARGFRGFDGARFWRRPRGLGARALWGAPPAPPCLALRTKESGCPSLWQGSCEVGEIDEFTYPTPFFPILIIKRPI